MGVPRIIVTGLLLPCAQLHPPSCSNLARPKLVSGASALTANTVRLVDIVFSCVGKHQTQCATVCFGLRPQRSRIFGPGDKSFARRYSLRRSAIQWNSTLLEPEVVKVYIEAVRRWMLAAGNGPRAQDDLKIARPIEYVPPGLRERLGCMLQLLPVRCQRRIRLTVQAGEVPTRPTKVPARKDG